MGKKIQKIPRINNQNLLFFNKYIVIFISNKKILQICATFLENDANEIADISIYVRFMQMVSFIRSHVAGALAIYIYI